MRLKRQHRQETVAGFRFLPRRRDQGLVAAMHAVEIADGDDGAFQRLRHILEMAEYPHSAFGAALGAITSASPSTTILSATMHR